MPSVPVEIDFGLSAKKIGKNRYQSFLHLV